jgi:hypothetical protein
VKVNFETLETPIPKAVVYLDPHEFHSTWLGNKAVRTRMALATGAQLLILPLTPIKTRIMHRVLWSFVPCLLAPERPDRCGGRTSFPSRSSQSQLH